MYEFWEWQAMDEDNDPMTSSYKLETHQTHLNGRQHMTTV
jgi:hypothetical protein